MASAGVHCWCRCLWHRPHSEYGHPGGGKGEGGGARLRDGGHLSCAGRQASNIDSAGGPGSIWVSHLVAGQNLTSPVAVMLQCGSQAFILFR